MMIKPFADSDTQAAVDELSIENGSEVITISGSLEVTRDRVGLRRARELKTIIDAIIAELAADAALPEALDLQDEAPTEVRNPFA